MVHRCNHYGHRHQPGPALPEEPRPENRRGGGCDGGIQPRRFLEAGQGSITTRGLGYAARTFSKSPGFLAIAGLLRFGSRASSVRESYRSLTMKTTRLSTKGQIILPKSIRASRDWR